ncbi:MAG: cyclic 2,3-diphosphoglycerate synthetase [Candidatus Aminicenantes bacterium]|nr:cyclic 2,3-diphosphoglycerate synthetase [Candidatus Aminicenantes bacterium]
MIDANIIEGKRLFCLVDGEHYPPVTKWTIRELERSGGNVAGLLFVGGTEKVQNAVQELQSSQNKYRIYMGGSYFQQTLGILQKAVNETDCEVVVDLSDEPVVDYDQRFRIASLILYEGRIYVGADFHFKPPAQNKILKKPSLSIIGTGKRVGKTAVSVTIARLLDKNAFDPVVVAMGRGGPPEPEVIIPDKLDVSADLLISIAEKGGHAASDYWEDAVLAGVPTVGCRRCGGGMAGSPVLSNVLEGAEKTNEMPEKFVIMEGSGPTLPPVATDASIVVVGAAQPLRHIAGFFGEYRLMRSDLAVVTMCEEPIASQEKIKQLEKEILRLCPEMDIALTVFRPEPHDDITGRNVFMSVTAKPVMKDILSRYVEETFQCTVVGISTNLSNRKKLKNDLEEGLKKADVLLTEIKAASIDVAAKTAQEQECGIVFMHNKSVLIGGNVSDLEKAVLDLCQSVFKGGKK